MAIRRIGQILVDLGFITDDQLEMLLEEQSQNPGQKLGKIAEDMGLINEDQLVQALAEQFGLQTVDLEGFVPPDEARTAITDAMAQLYRIIPLQLRDNVLTIASCDPQNLSVQDELRRFLGYEIRMLVASENQIIKSIDKFFNAEVESIEKIIAELQSDAELIEASKKLSGDGPINLSDVSELVDSAPVRKLLNMVLLLAIKDQASDIHLEPFEDEFKIRVRADGVLFEMVPPPRHLANAIVSRVKIMANLDIAERRVPQDGRIELTVGGNSVDLRVSVLPTLFGESVVMRVLDRTVVQLDLNKIGMDPATLAKFRKMVHRPNGIILVTGPTGSGKTTTLYSVLNEMNEVTTKVITTEDPVEYEIYGLIQVPVNPEIDVTFATVLRAILRHDPDIILVGEIRDYETAEIAIQSALTGHVVFSTLHTNDAPTAITRLRDMGVPPFLITATVESVLAQRLVRKICVECRTQFDPSDELLMELQLPLAQARKYKFYYGKGCQRCNNTGYKGRTGIHELIDVTDDIRDLIATEASVDDIANLARSQGMTSLRESGLKLIFDGVTTIDEVVRETVTEGFD